MHEKKNKNIGQIFTALRKHKIVILCNQQEWNALVVVYKIKRLWKEVEGEEQRKKKTYS